MKGFCYHRPTCNRILGQTLMRNHPHFNLTPRIDILTAWPFPLPLLASPHIRTPCLFASFTPFVCPLVFLSRSLRDHVPLVFVFCSWSHSPLPAPSYPPSPSRNSLYITSIWKETYVACLNNPCSFEALPSSLAFHLPSLLLGDPATASLAEKFAMTDCDINILRHSKS
jgi:hypothetical protein